MKYYNIGFTININPKTFLYIMSEECYEQKQRQYTRRMWKKYDHDTQKTFIRNVIPLAEKNGLLIECLCFELTEANNVHAHGVLHCKTTETDPRGITDLMNKIFGLRDDFSRLVAPKGIPSEIQERMFKMDILRNNKDHDRFYEYCHKEPENKQLRDPYEYIPTHNIINALQSEALRRRLYET